jgi:hypothetical protein
MKTCYVLLPCNIKCTSKNSIDTPCTPTAEKNKVVIINAFEKGTSENYGLKHL